MHKMVTRNRGRKASIDIDNEALPVLVANEDLNADQTSSFLCAESKDAESEIDLDNEDIHDLDSDADDYVDVDVDMGADSDDDRGVASIPERARQLSALSGSLGAIAFNGESLAKCGYASGLDFYRGESN